MYINVHKSLINSVISKYTIVMINFTIHPYNYSLQM